MQYLICAWDDESLATTLGEKTLFVSNNDCYSFTVKDERMCKICERSLYSTHEEADLRMIFHLNSVTNLSNVVIQTSDTDVLVIALGCIGSMSSDVQI